jgi:hypothetical protein
MMAATNGGNGESIKGVLTNFSFGFLVFFVLSFGRVEVFGCLGV